jgi:hypothetical protein
MSWFVSHINEVLARWTVVDCSTLADDADFVEDIVCVLGGFTNSGDGRNYKKYMTQSPRLVSST